MNVNAADEDAKIKDELLSDLYTALAEPDDLAKVDAMLEETQQKQAANSSMLSELIGLHCTQVRKGLQKLETAMQEIKNTKADLLEIQDLCKRTNVLGASESRHAATLSTVQANVKRTIGGVENIYKFPARAEEALALLREVDGDHVALMDVFHDLSNLLATHTVAEELIADLREQAGSEHGEDMVKVEAYFGRVQRVNQEFKAKVLSYFDDIVLQASQRPQHLVMALRVVMNQHMAWEGLKGKLDRNPWGAVYREEAIERMKLDVRGQMQPVLLDAEQIFNRWMHNHEATAASYFLGASKHTGPGHRRSASDMQASGPGPHRRRASDGNLDQLAAQAIGRGGAAVAAAAARLIGGVGMAPIQLQSMAQPAAVTEVAWLSEVEVDEWSVNAMNDAMEKADKAIDHLVRVFDEALPCFPSDMNPLQIMARCYSQHSAYALDLLGQSAAAYDNGTLLNMLGWPDRYQQQMVNLGLPDDIIELQCTPQVKTPGGEFVGMHGLDVARLVYIDRIRGQMAKAFKNMAEIDLVKEPEEDAQGRLWTPSVIEMFRFLTEQVKLAASAQDKEVMRHVAQVALQVMQSYQGLVCQAMVERTLEFNTLVAIVNNNLVAYEQSQELTSTLEESIQASPGANSSPPKAGRETTESLMMPDGGSAFTASMDEACGGFLNVAKAAIEKVVDCVFADQGMVKVAKQLFCSQDWKEGVATRSFLLTIDDYMGDLNRWLDGPMFKRACNLCMKGTAERFQTAFLSQMPNNSLVESDMERFEKDVEDVKEFFLRFLDTLQVEQVCETLEHFLQLVQCESVEEFDERYTFMLDEDCQIKPRDVAMVCRKRKDISGSDASAVERECETSYQQWLEKNKQQKANGSPTADADTETAPKNLLAGMYQRLVKAVALPPVQEEP